MASKIVVVDDELTSRKLLANVVERSGNIAVIASSAARAFSILEDNPDIRLVITDMAMPDIDGMAFIRQMRGDERFSAIPVIIVSGVVKVSEIDAILRMGAQRFVPKPIDASVLLAYLGDLLGQPTKEYSHVMAESGASLPSKKRD